MLLAAFLVSCDLLLDLIEQEQALKADEFYAIDFTKDNFYKVKAEMLAEGRKCFIWAEKGSGITKRKAEEFAAKYDNVIRPKIVGAFGMKDVKDEAAQYHFDDILDYANWLAGKEIPNPDPKLTILLLDIKDSFKDPKKDSYVAGYFYSGNFYPENYGSNARDMIYVDTYPGLKMVEEQTYATFAHELQHLINFATTTLKRKGPNNTLIPMDTWIDEGLSSQAEHIYLGKNIEDHINRFSKDEYGTIAQGNNFFVWGNHTDKPMAILDEYSTVYLFFRWLYLQAADKGLQSNIFLDIATSDLSDHNIITNAAKKIRPEWADWNVLLRSWLAANYYPANSDYGYKDSYFQEKIKVRPITPTSIKLYPGEGVYSSIKNPFRTPQVTGTNIRYAGLPGSSSSIVTQGPFNSGVLLTYNANTNNSKSTASETGYLTGVSASVSSDSRIRMAIEDAQTETHTGPYVIDARDYGYAGILGRDK